MSGGGAPPLGALELAAAYRSGELTPSEAVERSIETAEATRGLNALAADAFERARTEAADATAAFAARLRGAHAGGGPPPLEGIPFLAKDLFDTAGVETAYGSPIFAGNVPRRDAEAVRRLRAAGAILLAKTSTDEFAYGITSHNPHLGPVRNPWAPDRVSGGSSGGSAAALAAGVAPLALGSDTGGSIRVPAAFCGVVGFKPSYGAVSTAGLFPMARSLDHSGPMARSPLEARLLFEVLAGPFVGSSESGPGSRLRPRLVVCPDLQIAEPSADVEAVFAAAIEAARSAGAEIVERRYQEAGRVFPTFLTIQRAETSFTHRGRSLYPERRRDYGVDVGERLDAAAAVSLDEYLRAEADRERLRSAFLDLFAGGALLLAPIQARTPTRIDAADVEEETRRIVMDQTVPENLFGLPACALRAGFDDQGVPVGVQVVGPPGADAAVLDLAERLYAATPYVQERWPAMVAA
jgi:aspartyl-tRNA(Asn)/glutamyl-tRNA(Gln) amidotransferase subunit A